MTAPLLPPERLARLVEDAPPAAEPAILARVEGEVTNLPHGHAITETETGDRVMTPEWPGAHVGQRVEVLVRALDGVDVPAPPASEAPRSSQHLASPGLAGTFSSATLPAPRPLTDHCIEDDCDQEAVDGPRCPEHAQQEKDDRHRLAHGSETCPVCLRSNCRARRMQQGADPMSDEWNDACRECRDYTRTPTPKPEETPTCTFCKGRGTNVAVDAIEADGRLVNPRPAPCMVCDGSGRQPPCEDCGLPSPRCVCGLVPTPGEGST